MNKEHHYQITTEWTGNQGTGTSGYRAYNRNHVISADGKASIAGSSDPSFLGDKTRYNPEEMLLASLSSCHMLWYLHLCAEAGVVVVTYEDHAAGTMTETADGGGHFVEVTLNPAVVVTEPSMIGKANELHHRANQLCYIANSVNFPVKHIPNCTAQNSL